MSFELMVFVEAVPWDLPGYWRAYLKEYGLRCLFPPRYNPARWNEQVSVCVEVRPARFPGLDRYPDGPLLATLDVDRVDRFQDNSELFITEAPEELRPQLKQADYLLTFSSPAGRTPLDLRLQCLTAAVLAEVANGVMLDPQEDVYIAGADALLYVLGIVQEYEQQAAPNEWQIPPFEG